MLLNCHSSDKLRGREPRSTCVSVKAPQVCLHQVCDKNGSYPLSINLEERVFKVAERYHFLSHTNEMFWLRVFDEQLGLIYGRVWFCEWVSEQITQQLSWHPRACWRRLFRTPEREESRGKIYFNLLIRLCQKTGTPYPTPVLKKRGRVIMSWWRDIKLVVKYAPRFDLGRGSGRYAPFAWITRAWWYKWRIST